MKGAKLVVGVVGLILADVFVKQVSPEGKDFMSIVALLIGIVSLLLVLEGVGLIFKDKRTPPPPSR
jgi:TRAP-type C4-dicarboxylate transport system permease small subunit